MNPHTSSNIFSKQRLQSFVWINLVAAFALVIVLTVAATHQHFSIEEDSDCFVCSVVHHDASGAVSVEPPTLALTYHLTNFNPLKVQLFARTSFFLQPPSCGPPLV